MQLEDVAQGFQNIENELRSQYSLEYRPSKFRQDGSFRTIQLQSRDPRYVVRSRTGYFAPRSPGMSDVGPSGPARPLSKKEQKAQAKLAKAQASSSL